MCGHVGIYGEGFTSKETQAFNYMLFFDQLRGVDSTGILAVDKDDKCYLFKEIGTPDRLYAKYGKDFTKGCIDFAANKRALIGHNRWKTQGGVDVESAHPFDMGRIIGAHNGTVDQWSMRDFSGYKDFKIDSQIIFKELNDNNDLKKLWATANGPMALVWWDKETKVLNWVRNKDRPLTYAYSEDKTKVFWASESWMIEIAAGKSGIKIGDVYSVEADCHYTITLDKTVVVKKLKLDPFVPPKVNLVSYQHGSYGSYTGYKMGTSYKGNFSNPKGKKVEFWAESWARSSSTHSTVVSGWFEGIAVADSQPVRVFYYNVKPDLLAWLERDMGEDFNIYVFDDCVEMFDHTLGKNVWRSYNDAKIPSKVLEVAADKGTVVLGNTTAMDMGYDHKGVALNHNTFMSKVRKGCAECKKKVFWKDRHMTTWRSEKEILCPKCADKEFAAQKKTSTAH